MIDEIQKATQHPEDAALPRCRAGAGFRALWARSVNTLAGPLLGGLNRFYWSFRKVPKLAWGFNRINFA
jgi:hypothetical protein